MRTFAFIHYGEPKGKGRARHRSVKTKSGKVFSQTYTPKETEDAEDYFRSAAERAMNGQPLFVGPMVVTGIFMRSVPKSFSAKKREMALRGEIRPTSKPDLDNYEKLLDALNKVVWDDDSDIIEWGEGHGKFYGDPPRTEITVREWKFEPIDSVSQIERGNTMKPDPTATCSACGKEQKVTMSELVDVTFSTDTEPLKEEHRRVVLKVEECPCVVGEGQEKFANIVFGELDEFPEEDRAVVQENP